MAYPYPGYPYDPYGPPGAYIAAGPVAVVHSAPVVVGYHAYAGPAYWTGWHGFHQGWAGYMDWMEEVSCVQRNAKTVPDHDAYRTCTRYGANGSLKSRVFI